MAEGNTEPITQKTAADHPAPDAAAETGPRNRDSGARLARRLVVLAVVIVSVAGAWPAYRWWHSYRTGQFKTACKEALAEKDWKAAETIANRWLEWDSTSNDAWVFLADASVQLNKVERAADCLGNVDSSYDGALQALAVRADLLFSDLNRVYDAAETWKRMLEINSLADVARQRLIYFYAMSLQREKMLKHIRTAMRLQCEPPEAYAYYILAYEVNFSDGLSLIAKWRRNAPDDEALEVAHAVYIAKYVPDELLGGASSTSPVAPGDLSLINDCLKKYPGNIEVLAFHLDKAVYEGDAERVLKLLQQCPPSAERDARFWRYRGWYLAQQGRYRQAEQALRKALAIHPVDWRALWSLAGVLRRLGRTDEASETSRVALMGKELRQELFELPNARALNHDLMTRIRAYLEETAPQFVRDAIARRMDSGGPAPEQMIPSS